MVSRRSASGRRHCRRKFSTAPPRGRKRQTFSPRASLSQLYCIAAYARAGKSRRMRSLVRVFLGWCNRSSCIVARHVVSGYAGFAGFVCGVCMCTACACTMTHRRVLQGRLGSSLHRSSSPYLYCTRVHSRRVRQKCDLAALVTIFKIRQSPNYLYIQWWFVCIHVCIGTYERTKYLKKLYSIWCSQKN